MRLISLNLKNFKGAKEFKLEPRGRNVSIFGENATGKTTLMDAYLWLLFGKDSQGKADFEIKPLSSEGEAAHNLEHEVEAVFEMDPDFSEVGQPAERITIRKVLTEKWTKKRGAATSEFTGHTINHFIDGVPVTERDFKARIAEIAPEETFRLLSNPRHFSEQLTWQRRRQILLDVCGDVTDADIIASDPALSDLPSILGKRSMDDYKKVVASRRAEINKALTEIPARISENQAVVSDVSNLDPTSIKSRIAHLETDRKEKAEELFRLENGGEIAEKRKRVAEIDAKILDAETRARRDRHAKTDLLEKEYRTARAEMIQSNEIISAWPRLKEKTEAEILRLSSHMDSLRQKSKQTFDSVFTFSGATSCPTCGQDLPEDQIDSARQKALEAFNSAKAKTMEEIKRQGLAAKDELETTRQALVEASAEVERAKGLKELAEKQINSLEAQLNAPAEKPDTTALEAEKTALESAISELAVGSHDAIEEVKSAIASIESEISEERDKLAKIDSTAGAQNRISQLKRQERDLSTEFERLEGHLHLIDVFERRKVALLDDKINSRFKLARFRLFEEQVNGGLNPCCRVTVNGVPYDKGLNNSAQILSGLDIIETLSAHYGLSVPVIIDNAESTTRFPVMSAQMIKLYVSEKDKTLRIEYE